MKLILYKDLYYFNLIFLYQLDIGLGLSEEFVTLKQYR